MNVPNISPETKQAMLEFFMKTSMPRTLEKRRKEQENIKKEEKDDKQ